MSAASGETAAATLLAAIADPAVIVDDAGRVVACNPAARELLGLPEDVEGQLLERLTSGALAASARSITMADATLGRLLVWPPDHDGPGPNDIALEKLDSIGRIAGGVDHDLMSPLTAVMGFADLQATDPGVPLDLREAASLAQEAAHRVQAMIRSMLGFSRGLPVKPEPLAIGPLVRDLMALLAHATTNMQTRVVVPDGLPEVIADRGEARQALLAILLNGLEAQGTTWAKGAQPVKGRLIVSGRAIDDARGNRIRLAIEDGGPVVPVDERPSLFSGAGPGRAGRDLAVARALVVQAGGRVSYEPVRDGNRIVVELPVAGTALPPETDPAEAAEAEPGQPLVLICDAQPLIRTLLVRYVRRLGAEALEARDSREALAILSDRRVSLIIADLGARGDDEELYRGVLALRPELATRFILLSADPGDARIVEFTRRTGVPVMPKPFDNVRLEQLVREAIEG